MKPSGIMLSCATALCALLSVSSAEAQAASHPHFAGTWILDPAKTVVDGQGAVPTAATYVILERGDSIIQDRTVTASGATVASHVVIGADGKTWKNTVPVNGEDVATSSVASWDSAVLVIHTSMNMMGADVDLVDRWTLSSDGHTLTTSRTITVGGDQAGAVTMMYTRKP